MTTVAFKGWNSATQGWGGGTYGNDVAFPSSTSALNSVTVTGAAKISVTGIAGTTALGNTFETVNGVSATASVGTVTVTGTANISVTGVAATGAIGEARIPWNQVIPNQTPDYSGITASQSPSYSSIASTQNPSYTPINP